MDPATRSALPDLREQRYWLLEELEALLEKLALKSQLLLCINDVQWADSAFLAALRTLPARLMPFPVVWLIAYRSPQAPPELRDVIEGLEQIGVDRLLLSPLSDETATEVVTDVFSTEPDDALRELVKGPTGVRSYWWSCCTGSERTVWSASALARQSWSRSACPGGSGKECSRGWTGCRTWRDGPRWSAPSWNGGSRSIKCR